jgi:hypothetical protein
MAKVVPLQGGKRKGGGFGLPSLLVSCAVVAATAGFLSGAWVARWPQRVIEVTTTIEKAVPFETRVYYPVRAVERVHGHTCPSVADALNMFEFLERHDLSK